MPVNKAVGSANSLMRLFLSTQNMGDHRLFGREDGRDSVEIECVRVDDYLTRHMPEAFVSISAIKMDVQGYEVHACEGMTKLLKCTPVLLTEYQPNSLREAGSSDEAYLSLLESLNFNFTLVSQERSATATYHRISKQDLLSRSYNGDQHDDLCCRKERVQL